MSDNIVIQTYNLCKMYGSVLALDRISLSVYKGEVFGFLGPNGAEKTTTIGILLDLVYPTSGWVEIMGVKVTPVHNHILGRAGSMFGSPGFMPYLTGHENLVSIARLHRQSVNSRVKDVLEQVGLTSAANRKVKGYSLGMKQRLSLAAALLHQPDLLILDEPTNGIDPVFIHEIRFLLCALAASGTTVFLSSHLLREVEQMCDRVAILDHGRVIAQGKVSELLGSQQIVRVQVTSVSQATQALHGGPDVTSIRVNGNFLEVEGISSSEVVSRLAAHAIYPSEVITRHGDLETMFLQLTENVPEEH